MKKIRRVFLLSTTHGAEMNGLGAFVETLKFLKAKRVINKNWKFGKNGNEVNNISKNNNLLDKFYFAGQVALPSFCKDDNNQINSGFRTLFIQEMLKNRV